MISEVMSLRTPVYCSLILCSVFQAEHFGKRRAYQLYDNLQ